MKLGEVIQYEPEVPYFKHRFSFQICHSQFYFLLFVRQMPWVISYFT